MEGLTDWLFRGLRQARHQDPDATRRSQSILDLVLQVLGVTVETLWTKLGERIGPETRRADPRRRSTSSTARGRSSRTCRSAGIAAIWEYVSDQLSGLWDTMLGTAKDWIMQRDHRQGHGQAAVDARPDRDHGGHQQLRSRSSTPSSQPSSTCASILRDRRPVRLHDRGRRRRQHRARRRRCSSSGLAAAVPIAIGFLANQVGLGNVPEKIVEIIVGLRELIDQALDWLFDQAMELGKAALDALGVGDKQKAEDAGPSVSLTDDERQKLYADVRTRVGTSERPVTTPQEAQDLLQATLKEFRPRGLKQLTLEAEDPEHAWHTQLIAHASPGEKVGGLVLNERLHVGDLNPGWGTALLATLNGQELGVAKAAGKDLTASADDHSVHAEQWLLTELSTMLPLIKYGRRGEKNELLVKLTRSPCPSCLARLRHRLDTFKTARDPGYDIDLTLEVASIHKRTSKSGDEQFVRLLELEGHGLTVQAWDILKELESLGFSEDEVSRIRNDSTLMKRLEARVAAVTARISKYRATKASV